MKWKKRDVNVVPAKFSKLKDIVTSLILLKLFFDDVLVDMIVGYTKLYSHREKANVSLTFLIKKFAYSYVCYYLVGAISFQTVKCIGRRPLIFLCKQGLIQCLVMRLSVFFGISVLVTTNNMIDK